jgi:hypothetical protein
VTAYDEPLARRLARWSRRNWGVAQVLLAGLLLVMTAGLVAAALFGRQANRESGLRREGLRVSAEFAARTIANQIDIRWQILDKEAADPELHAGLVVVNQDPDDESAWQPLQAWIDSVGPCYENLQVRSLFVNARDGTQVARYPSHDEQGERYSSLGTNYDYRDYFHGLGEDYYDDQEVLRSPLKQPHNSTAMESTVAADLIVVFSTPIIANGGAAPIGVLGMSIHLGSFAALDVELPVGQEVMLVDTRQYYMRRASPEYERRKECGEGLVLHHESMGDLKQRRRLPHVDGATIDHMLKAKKQWLVGDGQQSIDNLLDDFVDPMVEGAATHSLAAFAPVIVTSRPEDQQDTGWFVIIRQAD